MGRLRDCRALIQFKGYPAISKVLGTSRRPLKIYQMHKVFIVVYDTLFFLSRILYVCSANLLEVELLLHEICPSPSRKACRRDREIYSASSPEIFRNGALEKNVSGSRSFSASPASITFSLCSCIGGLCFTLPGTSWT